MDDSPVKKKRRKNRKPPCPGRKCLIHLDPSADDSTLSAFTPQSWEVSNSYFFYPEGKNLACQYDQCTVSHSINLRNKIRLFSHDL